MSSRKRRHSDSTIEDGLSQSLEDGLSQSLAEKHSKRSRPDDSSEEEKSPRNGVDDSARQDDTTSALYMPLSSDDREFRLLRITDRPDSDMIHCELRTFSLRLAEPRYVPFRDTSFGDALSNGTLFNDTLFNKTSEAKLKFKALSYCWGTAEAEHTIIVNGYHFKVRPLLFSFLELVAKEGDTSWYFIDAICICQGDVADKNHQVSFMGEVYRKAVEVVTWLGPLDNAISGDKKRRMAKLCDLGSQIISSPLAAMIQARIIRFRQLQEPSERAHDAKLFARPYIPGHHKGDEELYRRLDLPSLEGLLDCFCGDLYWTRVWIIQEILLARKLIFRTGDLSIDWQILLMFICAVHSSNSTIQHYFSTTSDWQESVLLDANNRSRIIGATSDLNGKYFCAHTALNDRAGVSLTTYAAQMLTLSILGRKLLLRQQGLYHDIPLHEVMLGFGLQQCTIPHDSIYGLLGLTQSRLQIDYDMPTMELQVRTLIEMGHSLRFDHSDLRYGTLDVTYLLASQLVSLFGVIPVIVLMSEALKENLWVCANCLLQLKNLIRSGPGHSARDAEQVALWRGLREFCTADEIKSSIDTNAVASQIAEHVERCKRENLSLQFPRENLGDSWDIDTYEEWIEYIDILRGDLGRRSHTPLRIPSPSTTEESFVELP